MEIAALALAAGLPMAGGAAGGTLVGAIRAKPVPYLGRASAVAALLAAGSAYIELNWLGNRSSAAKRGRAAYDSEVADVLRTQRYGKGEPLYCRDSATPLTVEELEREVVKRERGETATELLRTPPLSDADTRDSQLADTVSPLLQAVVIGSGILPFVALGFAGGCRAGMAGRSLLMRRRNNVR